MRLDGVLVDSTHRTISIPVKINTRTTAGPQEYGLVHQTGKTHESILSTTNSPFVIHTAALLLSPDIAPRSATNRAPASRLTRNSLQKDVGPKGVPLTLSVEWRDHTNVISIPMESLVTGIGTNKALSGGGWRYTGSELVPAGFSAQITGSIVSLVADPSALVHYAGPGNDDDKNWVINTNRMPPANVPLSLVLRFEK